MVQAGVQVGDVGVELVGDGGGAEPAVQQADRVGFLLQDGDDGVVEIAGAGDLAQQVVIVAFAKCGADWWWRSDLGGANAEPHAGEVGHAQAVRDADHERKLDHVLLAARDHADPVRGQTGGVADPGLDDAMFI